MSLVCFVWGLGDSFLGGAWKRWGFVGLVGNAWKLLFSVILREVLGLIFLDFSRFLSRFVQILSKFYRKRVATLTELPLAAVP